MIYTGYWAKIHDYELNHLTPVGISGWSPSGYTGKTYKKLAPKYSWWREWHDNNLSEKWYAEKYYEFPECVMWDENQNCITTGWYEND